MTPRRWRLAHRLCRRMTGRAPDNIYLSPNKFLEVLLQVVSADSVVAIADQAQGPDFQPPVQQTAGYSRCHLLEKTGSVDGNRFVGVVLQQTQHGS